MVDDGILYEISKHDPILMLPAQSRSQYSRPPRTHFQLWNMGGIEGDWKFLKHFLMVEGVLLHRGSLFVEQSSSTIISCWASKSWLLRNTSSKQIENLHSCIKGIALRILEQASVQSDAKAVCGISVMDLTFIRFVKSIPQRGRCVCDEGAAESECIQILRKTSTVNYQIRPAYLLLLFTFYIIPALQAMRLLEQREQLFVIIVVCTKLVMNNVNQSRCLYFLMLMS